MTKTINISDKAYEWLLKKSSQKTIEQNKSISMAEVVDDLIEENTNEKD